MVEILHKGITKQLGEMQKGDHFYTPVSVERSNLHTLAARKFRHISVRKQGNEYRVECLGVYGSKESLYAGKKIRRDSGNGVAQSLSESEDAGSALTDSTER